MSNNRSCYQTGELLSLLFQLRLQIGNACISRAQFRAIDGKFFHQ